MHLLCIFQKLESDIVKRRLITIPILYVSVSNNETSICPAQQVSSRRYTAHVGTPTATSVVARLRIGAFHSEFKLSERYTSTLFWRGQIVPSFCGTCMSRARRQRCQSLFGRLLNMDYCRRPLGTTPRTAIGQFECFIAWTRSNN